MSASTRKEAGYSKMTDEFTVRGIIRAARGKKTQAEYASELGIGQGLLSKYENGKVNPPSEIIERCMHDMNKQMGRKSPNADAIARRVRHELTGSENEKIRVALEYLLDRVVS